MMSRTASSGVQRLQSGSLPGARGYIAPANSILVPPGAPLERSDVLQALIDIFALIFIALFLCATAISFPVALFLLIFCSF